MVILVIINCSFAKIDHLFDSDINLSDSLLLCEEEHGLMRVSCGTWYQGFAVLSKSEAWSQPLGLSCDCSVEFFNVLNNIRLFVIARNG